MEKEQRLSPGQWHPTLDVCVGKEHVVIRMEVPGVSDEDIRIIFRRNNLIIEGTKREPAFAERERLRFIRLERGYGAFRKIVESKWIINPQLARAVLSRGVLTIHLPIIQDRRGGEIHIPIEVKSEE
jgi:HSP20 family protein